MAFVAFFLVIGIGADVFVLNYHVPGIEGRAPRIAMAGDGNLRSIRALGGFKYPFATIIALMIAGVFMANAFFRGTKMVLKSVHAYRANPDIPQHRQLLNVVEEMKIASGLPMPEVYIIPDADLNAFATGLHQEGACVAVTEGLLLRLNREELQAVVAHELSHIHNMDMRMMTILAAMAGAIVLIADMLGRYMFFGRGSGERRSGGGPLMVVWIILLILSPIIVNLMAMAVSRRREYLADATAAEFTRNPLALVSALKKISGAVEPTRSIGKGVAHMCIEDPRGSEFSSGTDSFSNMFSTHPPVTARIEALEAMAYQNNS